MHYASPKLNDMIDCRKLIFQLLSSILFGSAHNPYSAGIDFSRQIWRLTTKVDPRTVKIFLMAVDP